MIVKARGNLLEAEVDALVNAVNTVGVMGAGIALQFKKAYPAMFDAYRKAANAGGLSLGKVQVWETGQMTHPRYIINFPTKGHWRETSKMVDVESGLADLTRAVREMGIRSIAIPALGCGHGGLPWVEVEAAIHRAFEDVGAVRVLLYAPGAPTQSLPTV